MCASGEVTCDELQRGAVQSVARGALALNSAGTAPVAAGENAGGPISNAGNGEAPPQFPLDPVHGFLVALATAQTARARWVHWEAKAAEMRAIGTVSHVKVAEDRRDAVRRSYDQAREVLSVHLAAGDLHGWLV